MNKIMKLAFERARETMKANIGGPFGAAVIDEDGNIITISSNSLLRDNDPTAHAEVNAIREACKKLNTYNLKGCMLYTTSHPCPMCLSAIIWANINKIYYGCTVKDVNEIGFRDEFIYNFINNGCSDANVIDIQQLDREECIKLFEEYKDKTIY